MSITPQKQCQNCKSEFTIAPEDFKFYEKISVPPPTWCPECRMQRRMAFRNERSLYPRACDLCKKDVIAIYPEKVPFPVYCQTCWWSDKWDAEEYGQGFDVSRPFFEQFKELQTRVPRPHTANYAEARLINSLYTKDVKFTVWCVNAQDTYDYFAWGDVELCYEAVACGDKSYGLKFTHTSWSTDRDIEYSNLCFSSAHLFGSIGLRSKKYCILNKQYLPEEYERQVSRIKEQMNALPYKDKKGRIYAYGEFFPPELSPFSYHDTVAQEYFPLSREKAMEEGYIWREQEKRELTITIESGTLPDRIGEVAQSIGKEIIGCAHKGECEDKCSGAFRIIPQELAFYRKNKIPLPRLCSNCRYGERIKKRNPLKLWHRACMCNQRPTTDDQRRYKNTTAHFHSEKPCPNEFETSYAPERKEIVYCEKCYLAEVA